MNYDVGYFVFSLDTELAWGELWGRPQRTSRTALNERKTIKRILDLMDEYGIVATWAVTGHLFYDACEKCSSCPIRALEGTDDRFGLIWDASDGMWYGGDIVDALIARESGHEIGFHGYTHRTFDTLSDEEASFEIEEWQRLGKRKSLIPRTAIFPQGRIKHLQSFRDAGFICYRGREVVHPVLTVPLLGKVLNKINLKLAILPPQVFEASVDASGLVNIPGSLWLFRTNRAVERVLDALNLHKLRLMAAARAIVTAAEDKKIVHLWIHPQEIRTEKDFAKLRFVFESFAQQARTGKIRSITMADLAQQVLKDHAASSVGLDNVFCNAASATQADHK